MFDQLESNPTLIYWLLPLAPFILSLAVFIFAVLNRHKMRAMVSVGVILLLTGGAVAAYENEHDGDFPSNIEEVQQVPTSVKNVVSRNIAGVMGEASPFATPKPTPRPKWRPTVDGHGLGISIADGSLQVAVSCYHEDDLDVNTLRVPRSKIKTVYVSRGDAGDMGAYRRACAKLG